MEGRIIGSDAFVTFNPEGHIYKDLNGVQYKSVSNILNTIEIPFDREGISMRMAQSEGGTGTDILNRQAEILEEWDQKLEDSIEKGNWIHDGLEKYHKLGVVDDALKPVIDQLKPLYSNYFKLYPEVVLFDPVSQVAGQTDLVIQRQRGKNSVFDFYDYKTNQQKGIKYDSINRKKDPWKHYNKFFLPPFDHLEDCNYNRYSLQLSLYARMAEKRYGLRIGKLAIIFINNRLRVIRYPVVYLKYEAEILLAHSQSIKTLPKIDEKGTWEE